MGAKGLVARGPPPEAVFLFYIRIAILVLSVIILAIAAYASSLWAGYYYGGGSSGGYLIFITILSLILYGAIVALSKFAPRAFFRILVVIFCSLSVIFWLSGWAWAASIAGFWLTYCGDQYCKSEGGALAACAGLGAVTWILTIVHLVFFILACVKDPAYKSTPAGQPATANQAELGQIPPKQDTSASPITAPVTTHPPQ